MILSPTQIQELLQVIDNFHVLFVANQVGVDVLTPKDLKVLKDAGINVKKLPKTGKIDDAFRFGILAEALGHNKAKTFDYLQFKKFLASGKFLPLTNNEESALKAIKYQAYNDIKGLGNKINRDFTQILIEVDQRQRAKYEKDVLDATEQAVLNRETVAELSSRIGHKTGDWSRDLDRVADYLLHSAFDYGKAHEVLEKYGEEGEVYKSVYQGACKHCVEKYLTNGLGSEPRVFKVGELLANGTNIGRKTAEWMPVVGPLHPFCRCETHYKEPNTAWDVSTQDFTKIVRNTYGVKRKSKIQIKITKE